MLPKLKFTVLTEQHRPQTVGDRLIEPSVRAHLTDRSPVRIGRQWLDERVLEHEAILLEQSAALGHELLVTKPERRVEVAEVALPDGCLDARRIRCAHGFPSITATLPEFN